MNPGCVVIQSAVALCFSLTGLTCLGEQPTMVNVTVLPVATAGPKLSVTTSPSKPKPILPDKAYALIPYVNKSIDLIWPDMTMRSYIPAQIEQESCISLKHKGCWNPSVELKTSREYGFGLGQFTIAYNKDKSVRFNTWAEVKAQSKYLKDWAWTDRYNPEMQIRAMIIKNLFNWKRLTFPIKNDLEKYAFLAATYNGGSVTKDRNLCIQRNPNCDPSSWFATSKMPAVESYSVKSKVKQPGYGKSFFDISREYPKNVLFVRRSKYIPYVEK